MNKLISGIVAIGIYFILLFFILMYYNIHKIKAKNYVEKNSNRVTVTLVNSDTTILNKSSKKSTPIKPNPITSNHKKENTIHHATPHHIAPPKKAKHHSTPTKKDIIKRARERKKEQELKKKKEAQRLARIKREQEELKKKKEAQRLARIKREEELKKKKEAQRLARIKREQEELKKKKEAQRLARIKREEELKKKKEAQRLARIKREQEELKKKKEAQRLARERARAEEERKKRAKNLFSSVNTNRHRDTTKQPKETSHVRHNSSIVDRIKNTHQSGRTSDKNREKGIKNAYIAKVKRQLSNWNAQSNYKGHSATIVLTIMNSGKFRYTIKNSTSMAMTSGLREFLDQLNRIGLGRHTKSTPYEIKVTFKAR